MYGRERVRDKWRVHWAEPPTKLCRGRRWDSRPNTAEVWGGGQGSHGPTSRALPLGSRQARASECPQVLSVLSTLVNDILDKLPVALSIRDRGAALLCKVDSLRCEPCKGLAWG